MPHLPAGPGFALVVEMEVGAWLGGQLWPAVYVLANEVFHSDRVAYPITRAERQATDRADMLFELRSEGPLYRPVAAVVDARRDLVDQRTKGCREEFHGEHANMLQHRRNIDRHRRGFVLVREHDRTSRNHRIAQDAAGMNILDRFPVDAALLAGCA